MFLAAKRSGRPCGIGRALFALVGDGVVGRSGIWALVAGQITGAPEGSGGRTLGVCSGTRGLPRRSGCCGFIWIYSWTSCSCVNFGPCSSAGLDRRNIQASLGTSVKVFVFFAGGSHGGLINAFLSVLLPNLVSRARPARLNIRVEVGRGVIAFVAGKSPCVPHRSFPWAGRPSSQSPLAFVGFVIEVLPLFAATVIVALMIACNEYHILAFASGLT
jgi:hypothetical protein